MSQCRTSAAASSCRAACARASPARVCPAPAEAERTSSRMLFFAGAPLGSLPAASRGRCKGPLAAFHGDEVSLARAEVDLPGPRDLLFRVLEQLLPLGDPAGCPGNREEHRESRRGNPDGLVDE